MTVAVATMKRCSCCKQELPLEMFSKNRLKKDGLNVWCRACQRRYELERNYGFTPEAFDQMLESQGHRCAICGTDTPGGKGAWHVDHDHDTGAVRGLLCHHCNTAIGNLKDDPELLRKAANYIESHR
jgi:hypothetical protein